MKFRKLGLTLTALIAITSGCGGATTNQPATPPDQKAVSESSEGVQARLQGRWKVVSVQANDSATASALKSGDLKLPDTIISEDQMGEDNGKGGMKPESTFKVDPTKTPWHIDLVSVKRPEDKTPGICKLEGTTLTLCLGKTGKLPMQSRPDKFSVENKDTRMLFVFEKQE